MPDVTHLIDHDAELAALRHAVSYALANVDDLCEALGVDAPRTTEEALRVLQRKLAADPIRGTRCRISSLKANDVGRFEEGSRAGGRFIVRRRLAAADKIGTGFTEVLLPDKTVLTFYWAHGGDPWVVKTGRGWVDTVIVWDSLSPEV